LAAEPAIMAAVEATGRRTADLVGAETDVCVAQSAVGLLDHIGGWRRAYADENAVLHVRTPN
jgi:nicotinamidase-related amidase